MTTQLPAVFDAKEQERAALAHALDPFALTDCLPDGSDDARVYEQRLRNASAAYCRAWVRHREAERRFDEGHTEQMLPSSRVSLELAQATREVARAARAVRELGMEPLEAVEAILMLDERRARAGTQWPTDDL